MNTTATWGGKTEYEVIEIAVNSVNSALSKCPDPMVHKVMVLHILNCLIDWHIDSGNDAEAEGNIEESEVFRRDIPKLVKAARSIASIDVSGYDFHVPFDS